MTFGLVADAIMLSLIDHAFWFLAVSLVIGIGIGNSAHNNVGAKPSPYRSRTVDFMIERELRSEKAARSSSSTVRSKSAYRDN
jgi:hypothetical protein